MEDITNSIKIRQGEHPLIVDLLKKHDNITAKTSFIFKSPTIISANENTIDGYKDFIYLMSGDKKTKGIIWQKLNTNQTYTYLINEEKNLIQCKINGKVIKDGESPTPEEVEIIQQKIIFFKQQYENNTDLFTIFTDKKPPK